MSELLSETIVYGCRLKDHAKLMTSSSGGAFTALSDIFLQSGDAVVCSTYNYDTHQQEFRIITTTEERDAAKGSKYFQSVPGTIFREAGKWLEDHPDKKLLFVGMGCQTAGFRSYIEQTGKRNRVVLVDIICHGSPSPMLWKEYASVIEKKNGKIEHLTFKDKRKGWKWPTAVVKAGGKEVSIREYVKVFSGRYDLRPSCHKCPYAAIERKSDITIGDFWHIEDKIPDRYDKRGTSLILIHTEKGKEVFEKAKENLIWFESNARDCWQLNLERPTAVSVNRKQFWEDYHKYGAEYVIKKYGHVSRLSKLKKNMKRVLLHK